MNRFSPHKLAFKGALAAYCLGSLAMAGSSSDTPPVVNLVLGPSASNVGSSWPDYATGVQSLNSDPSPDTHASHINDYRFQPDQLNVDPGSGDVTVLRTDQKDLVTKYVTEVIPVKSVNPREIVNSIRVLTAKEGGRAEVLLNGDKKTADIQVVCPAFQLPYIRAVIAALDEPWVKDIEDGSSAAYYKAIHRDIASIDAVAFDAGTPDQSYRSVDTKNNAVYYHDDAGSVGGYMSIVKKVDVPPHQTLVDITAYEITEQDDSKLGLDYIAWKNGPGQDLFRLVLTKTAGSEHFKNVTSMFDPFIPDRIAADGGGNRVRYHASSFYAAANYRLTAAFVDFLSVKGAAKVMTSGQLLAKSGTSATFERTDDLVAFSPTLPTDIATASSGRTLDYSLSDQKVGFFLTMLPYIGTESLEADVTVDISSLDGMTPQGMPIVDHRKISSSTVMRDGQPYVLGGLKIKSKTDSHSGMPFLGDIPVLGYAFGGKTKTNDEHRVVIVMKPAFMLNADTAPASTMTAAASGVIAASK